MSKDIIGLKQADGSFYPILKRGTPSKKRLQVTTSKDNQTTVQINLYCASDNSFADAEFLDTLKIDGLVPHEKKNHQIDLILSLDENDNLSVDLNDKESGKTAQKPVNFAPVIRQSPKDLSSELAAFDEQNLEKGDFDPLSAVSQTAAAAGVAFSGMPNTDYATGFANDPLFSNETKLDAAENLETEEPTDTEIPEETEVIESTDDLPDFGESFATDNSEETADPFASEEPEVTDNAETGVDDSFVSDDLGDFGNLPDFADDSVSENAEIAGDFASEETSEVSENPTETQDAENIFAEESFDNFAEIEESAPTVEKEAVEDDLTETAELPDFDDTFITQEDSAESDFDVTDDLSDFDESFATDNAEETTGPFASEETEVTDNAEANIEDSFVSDDLGDFGDLPDFADEEATDTSSESTDDSVSGNAEIANDPVENTDSYFDEATAVAAMAAGAGLGFAAGSADSSVETEENSSEGFVNEGDDDDFSLDDFSDLDAGFEIPNEEALAELDKEIDEINMNFSSQSALSEADNFVDDFDEDVTYDDLANNYSNSYAAENGITNFDFLDDKANRPKLPLIPLVCVLCAVISIASCFVIWLLFLNSKNAPAPVVAETTVTKEYQGVSVLKEDPAKPENSASQLEKALAQENSIIIIDAPIVIPIPIVPVVNQEETKRYQIKRGDTLWDIADSFYKDPWMYEKIAKANKIKNPDYILSGTWIEIPPM